MASPTRIDPTPVRLSTNLSIDRQTPKSDFGDRVKTGLDSAAGTVANGAAAAAPFLPGGAIVSAAVSSVTQLSNNASSGQHAATSAYAASGVVAIPGSSTGSINTTLSNSGGGVSSLGGGIASTNGGAAALTTGSGTNTLGSMSADMQTAMKDNSQLIQVQMAMQHENQVFSTVSNVLKTRHDTVKNTISNVR